MPQQDQILERFERGLKTAKSLGATAAKLSFNQARRTEINFEAGRLKSTESADSSGFSIEVLVGKKKGNADGNQLEDLDELIGRAVTLAQVGSAAHFEAYPAPTAITSVPRYSEKTARLPREKLIDACTQMVERLRAYNSDLFINATGTRSEGEAVLVTSGGLRHCSRATQWALANGCQRTQGTDMLFASFGREWNELNEFFDPNYLVEQTLADLRRAEKSATAPSGPITLLLPPETLPALLWVLAMGLNGRNVAKGDSPLQNRLGEKICDKSVTLIDNPHRPFAPGSSEIDYDGVPTRKSTLIKEGVLECFLYDLDSAGLAGATPTGHRHCSPYEVELRPGSEPHAKLIAGLKDALYIKELIGFGQGNIINGDFSCNVGLGYRIQNGQIVGRIKDTMISGNIYELLKHIVFSSDRDPVSLLPYALAEGATASSK